MKTKIIIAGLLLAGLHCVKAQSFVNLDFEQAGFVKDPSGFGYYASNAIPGWTGYDGTFALTDVYSNDVALSGGSISVVGTNWVYPQIQGSYFVLLDGFNYPGLQRTSAIGQTGQVPINALSFTFLGNLEGGTVSFNNQSLFVEQTGSTANYNIYVGDISLFAGQTGQLLFKTTLGGSLVLDSIQFSTTPIP